MGDRCYLTITFRAKDRKDFEDTLGGFSDEVQSEEGEPITGSIEQANYGLTDERMELAKAGFPFVGSHTAGGDYPPFVFAAANGQMVECGSVDESYPSVDVYENEQPSEIQLATAREYWKLYREAKAQMKAEDRAFRVQGGETEE